MCHEGNIFLNGKSVCDDYWEKIVGPKNAIFVCRFDLTSVSKQHMLLQDVGPGILLANSP